MGLIYVEFFKNVIIYIFKEDYILFCFEFYKLFIFLGVDVNGDGVYSIEGVNIIFFSIY